VWYNTFIKTDYPRKYKEFGFLELLNSIASPPPTTGRANGSAE